MRCVGAGACPTQGSEFLSTPLARRCRGRERRVTKDAPFFGWAGSAQLSNWKRSRVPNSPGAMVTCPVEPE